MTPRQISRCLTLALRRRRHSQADQLAIAAAGARGKPDDVKSQIKKLQKD